MDLKIIPNTNMLLKVDQFKGFSNQINVDELVINSTSGCNCNNYNNLAWKQCSLISNDFLFTSQTAFIYSYLSTKYGVFSSKFKGDMHDNLTHVLVPCCHAYLSVQNNLLLH